MKIFVDNKTGNKYVLKNGKYVPYNKEKGGVLKHTGDKPEDVAPRGGTERETKQAGSDKLNPKYFNPDGTLKDLPDFDPARWDKDPDILAKLKARDIEPLDDDEYADMVSGWDKAINDEDTLTSFEDETKHHGAVNTAKGAKNIDKTYHSDSIIKFKISFRSFIATQIEDWYGDSYQKFNKRYVDSGLIMPGSINIGHSIPKIFVYYDQSSSWSEKDIELGNHCISCINDFVKQGLISLEVFYFADSVTTTPPGGGGTNGSVVMSHIYEHNPTNVVILTDSDVWQCSPNVTVPGGVFFLWKNGKRSEGFPKALKGKKVTKEFNIFTEKR